MYKVSRQDQSRPDQTRPEYWRILKMYYYGYTNEKTDKVYFKNTLKYFDYISPLQTIYDSHVSFNGRAYVAEKLEYKESVKNVRFFF